RWRRVGPTPAQAQRDTATVLSAPEGETFQCAAFDAGGRLFVGTERRIGVLGEEGWVWISAEEGVDAVDPVAILVADESALWVGFARDGLLRLPRKSLW
ncbi:MAG: hypothetical protein O7D32_06675, partial [bacterium]|nr:hypothetical protein [bacterium]